MIYMAHCSHAHMTWLLMVSPLGVAHSRNQSSQALSQLAYNIFNSLLVYLMLIRYEMDLLMDGAYGYNLPGKMGPILGSLYVNTLIER